MVFLKNTIFFLTIFLFYSIAFAQVQPPEMVFVKGGKFGMGSDRGGKDEKPVHDVILDDYYIGKYEVTQSQWYMIMDKDPSKRYFAGCDSCPVERVTWYHVQGPSESNLRVIRGGSWFFDRSGIRVTEREGGNPDFRYGYVGFRLCRPAECR